MILALIENSKPKETSGGYFRLFGICKLSKLITKIHSTVISSGSELEKMILDRVELINDLDEFLKCDNIPQGIKVASKKTIKKSKEIDSSGQEPDFLVFKKENDKQECFIIELKDGHVFDTKKALAERNYIYDFSAKNARKFQYIFKCYVCAFNAESKSKIYHGFKGKINKDDLITGIEFCKLLKIDHIEIINERKKDREENVNYFIKELLTIDIIKDRIKKGM